MLRKLTEADRTVPYFFITSLNILNDLFILKAVRYIC